MTVDERPLHVTFGHSAAGSLRKALAMVGRDERVIVEPDDLGYGPIAPHTAARRLEFFEDVLGYEDDLSLVEQITTFWDEVDATSATLVAWMSRRSVREHAGFLALVARRDPPPLVVDVADVVLSGRDGLPRPDNSMAFAYVRDDQMIEHDLFRAARALSEVAVLEARATWTRLQAENADLRVLGPTGLVSVAVTFFDALVTACVTSEWQRCARVVGDSSHRSTGGTFRQCDDMFLWSRLRALVDAGFVEGRGDLRSMHASEVRRPVSLAAR